MLTLLSDLFFYVNSISDETYSNYLHFSSGAFRAERLGLYPYRPQIYSKKKATYGTKHQELKR